MTRLEKFLKSLNDEELAAFHHFRYHQFIKASREIIDREMTSRAIPTHFSFQELNPNEELNSEKCPRCKSEKFYDSTQMESIEFQYATEEVEVEYRTCLVCLYGGPKDEDKHRSVGLLGFIRELINRRGK